MIPWGCCGRWAAMVNNLMVMLASEDSTHPIVNAGTL